TESRPALFAAMRHGKESSSGRRGNRPSTSSHHNAKLFWSHCLRQASTSPRNLAASALVRPEGGHVSQRGTCARWPSPDGGIAQGIMAAHLTSPIRTALETDTGTRPLSSSLRATRLYLQRPYDTRENMGSCGDVPVNDRLPAPQIRRSSQ